MTQGNLLQNFYEKLVIEGDKISTPGQGKVTKDVKDDIIISLTTIPSRLGKTHLVVESLLRQTLKADKIILWLDNESFDGVEISSELNSQLERGLTVRYCDNYGSYKKLIPSLKLNYDSIITTCDDDAFYPEMWLEELYRNYKKNPTVVQCTRGHVMKFDLNKQLLNYMGWEFDTKNFLFPSLKVFPTGVGGVMYYPGCFHEDVLDEDTFLTLASNADDIRFKIMTLRNGIASQISESILTDKGAPFFNIHEIPNTQEHNLVSSNINQGNNDKVIKKLIEHYNLEELFHNLSQLP